MGKRTCQVSILPYWRASDDVLLKALVANGGELYSALEAVKGQVRKEKPGATAIYLGYSRITDEGIEALAGLNEVKEFNSMSAHDRRLLGPPPGYGQDGKADPE